MKSEQSYIISHEQVFITRGGVGVVSARHLQSEEDYKYYKVEGEEVRYSIRKPSGIVELPECIYRTPIRHECSLAASVCHTTRNYQRQLDKTYFKYYDDAEEVLQNIINFILWCKKIRTMDLKIPKVQMKKILEATEHLVKDVPDSPEMESILRSQDGSTVKMRSLLGPLAKDCAEDLDLIVRD